MKQYYYIFSTVPSTPLSNRFHQMSLLLFLDDRVNNGIKTD